MKLYTAVITAALLLLLSQSVVTSTAAQRPEKETTGRKSSSKEVKSGVKSIKSVKNAAKEKTALNNKSPDALTGPAAFDSPDYANWPFYRAVGIYTSHQTEMIFAPELSAYFKQSSPYFLISESSLVEGGGLKNGQKSAAAVKDNFPGGQNHHMMDFAPYKYESKYKDNLFSVSLPIPATKYLTISPVVSYLLNDNSTDKAGDKSRTDITQGEFFYGGINLIFNF